MAGGALLAHFSWSSVFYVSVPVAVIALIGGRLVLPESRDPNAGRFDPIGALLSVVGIALLTWSIIEAPAHGWGSAATVGGIGGSLAVLAVFAWWQARRPDPMLDVRLFRNPRFAAASGAIALAFFGLFGFIFMITQYFQIVRGFSPLHAGLATLPFAFVTAGFSPVAMIVMKRLGTKVVVAGGLFLMSGGLLDAATTPTDASYWGRIVVAMALMAAGLAFTTGPATDAIMGALPAGKAGAGSAVNDTTREVGGTLGVAIVGSVLNSAYGAHVLHGLVSLGAPASVGRAAGQSVVAGMTAAAHFPEPLRAAAGDAVSSAFMVGLHRGSFVAACTVAVAALVALVFLPARAATAGVDDAVGTERADEAAARPARLARPARVRRVADVPHSPERTRPTPTAPLPRSSRNRSRKELRASASCCYLNSGGADRRSWIVLYTGMYKTIHDLAARAPTRETWVSASGSGARNWRGGQNH